MMTSMAIEDTTHGSLAQDPLLSTFSPPDDIQPSTVSSQSMTTYLSAFEVMRTSETSQRTTSLLDLR